MQLWRSDYERDGRRNHQHNESRIDSVSLSRQFTLSNTYVANVTNTQSAATVVWKTASESQNALSKAAPNANGHRCKGRTRVVRALLIVAAFPNCPQDGRHPTCCLHGYTHFLLPAADVHTHVRRNKIESEGRKRQAAICRNLPIHPRRRRPLPLALSPSVTPIKNGRRDDIVVISSLQNAARKTSRPESAPWGKIFCSHVATTSFSSSKSLL